MTTKLPASFLPAKFQVLSGSTLKLIAIILMLIDHTGLCRETAGNLTESGSEADCEYLRN